MSHCKYNLGLWKPIILDLGLGFLRRNIRKIIHDHHQKVDNVEEVTQSLPIRTDFSLGMLEGLELANMQIQQRNNRLNIWR
ncbi:unnamed protein product [Rhizophagus irregularis]|nr:unnamed protein product [Rhizophagus irregularis]